MYRGIGTPTICQYLAQFTESGTTFPLCFIVWMTPRLRGKGKVGVPDL